MAFFQIIRMTQEEWEFENPTLLDNQIGVISDLVDNVQTVDTFAKLGDGFTEWNDLPLWPPDSGGSIGGEFVYIGDFNAQGLSTSTVFLWNENFENFQGAGTSFAIGDNHPQWGGTIWRDIAEGGWQPYYSIDVEPVVTLHSFSPFVGVFAQPIVRIVTGQNAEAIGIQGSIQSYGNKVGAEYQGNLTLKGIYGVAYVRSQNETAGYAGFFDAFTGGNLGGTNTTPIYGVYAQGAGGHNGTSPSVWGGYFKVYNVGGGGVGTIGDARGVQAVIDGLGDSTNITTGTGVYVGDWQPANGGVWDTSIGIYIDSTIDQGITRYAIKSDSFADSVFAGAVKGQINAYGAGWNGSSKFATEDAVYDKIESLGTSTITGTGTSPQMALWNGASSLVAAPMEYSSNRFLWYQNTNGDSFEMSFKGSNANVGEFWVGKQSGAFPTCGYIQVTDAASNAGLVKISTKSAKMGDLDGFFNSTYLFVDDTNNTFNFENGGGSTGSGTFDLRKIPIFKLSRTITAAGTTGAQTINRTAGQVNLAAGQQTLVVTNNKAAVDSLVKAYLMTDDNTAKSAIVTRAAGSFTIKTNAPATAEVAIGFEVFN